MKVNYFYAIAALGMMASCSNPDYFNTEEGSEYREYNVQKVKAEYEKNFLAAYGTVDPNETWDHSSFAPQTRATQEILIEAWKKSPTVVGDRVELCEEIITLTPEYLGSMESVQDQAGSQLDSNKGLQTLNGNKQYASVDGQNNEAWGTLDYSLIANGPMFIAPVWHGNCMPGYQFVVEGFDPVAKSIHQWVFTQEDIETVNNYGTYSLTEAFGHQGQMQPGSWLIPFEAGMIVRMYLRAQNSNGEWVMGSTINLTRDANGQSSQVKVRKNNGQLESIDLYSHSAFKDNHAPFFKEIFMLDDPMTREGNKTFKWEQDFDYNDLCVWVGSSTGDFIHTPNTFTIVRTAAKRYMFEDLGATQASDIDFNDLILDMNSKEYIIDLVENKYKYPEFVEEFTTRGGHVNYPKTGYGVGYDSFQKNLKGSVDATEYPIQFGHQSAAVRAMGGILNFKLYFADSNENLEAVVKKTPFFEKAGHEYAVTEMLNTTNIKTDWIIENIDFGSEFPWKPFENNIAMVVVERSNPVQELGPDQEASQWLIQFPKEGSVPSVIAVDQFWKSEIMLANGDEVEVEGWKPMMWNDERISVFTANSPMNLLQKETWGKQE